MADDTAPATPSLTDAVSQLVVGGGGGIPPPKEPGTVTGLGSTGTFTDTQKRIALMLLWIMIGVIAIIIVVSLIFTQKCWVADDDPCTQASTALDLLNKSLSPIFTAMIGLVGSVVGFYFGAKQGSDPS